MRFNELNLENSRSLCRLLMMEKKIRETNPQSRNNKHYVRRAKSNGF
jgi:hypothetical protein